MGDLGPADRLAEEFDRLGIGAGDLGRLGGPAEEFDPVDPDGRLGLRDDFPQLDGPLVLAQRLGVGTGMEGGLGGAARSGEGTVELAGLEPMVGDLGKVAALPRRPPAPAWTSPGSVDARARAIWAWRRRFCPGRTVSAAASARRACRKV